MAWRTVSVLALTLPALLVPAVANASTAAVIPRATYVKRADAVCLDVARKAVALQSEARRRVATASSETEVLDIFAEIYRRQLTLIQSMRRRLVAIGTPRGAASAARMLVEGIRTGEGALRQVIVAVENGSPAAMTAAVTRYRNVSLASARAVKRSSLGFKACGAGA
jgi:hypothetical protein